MLLGGEPEDTHIANHPLLRLHRLGASARSVSGDLLSAYLLGPRGNNRVRGASSCFPNVRDSAAVDPATDGDTQRSAVIDVFGRTQRQPRSSFLRPCANLAP